jgi:pimeloyl-ACP methyl ester carboxylesterase
LSQVAVPAPRAERVTTSRLATRVLLSGPDGGEPVLFLHGNLSSATWWADVLRRLPSRFRGIAPDQRGYGAADPAARIDATRGLADLAEDAVALLDQLEAERAHVVGSSLGGSVVWRLLERFPERLRTATLVAPGSPYGFGGTRDEQGTPCWPDFAGSGAGLAHPELVRRLIAGDRGVDHPFSPRRVLRAGVWHPPGVPAGEEELLEGTLATHFGEHAYPGDASSSPNWPFYAPGAWGPNNALSPRYARGVHRLWEPAAPRPPVLWIRGEHDLVVSDAAASDPGALGMRGLIPGWPGMDAFPPQPMLRQTRRVLRRYAGAGGAFREVVMPGCGHAPFVERPEDFLRLLTRHLSR